MADELNEILDDLDSDMLGDYEGYSAEAIDGWGSFAGNNGQMVILEKHILPAVAQHIKDAEPNWPFSANPDDYVEAIYNCFDPGVIAQAFSDTINDIYGTLLDYWLSACDTQSEHSFIAGPENAGPHSTHSIWRGTENPGDPFYNPQ